MFWFQIPLIFQYLAPNIIKPLYLGPWTLSVAPENTQQLRTPNPKVSNLKGRKTRAAHIVFRVLGLGFRALVPFTTYSLRVQIPN